MKIVVEVALIFCAFIVSAQLDNDALIVGGEDAAEHEAPYLVSVQIDPQGLGNFAHTCGGSILSPEWILTAAHCITVNQPLMTPPRIVAGLHNFAISTGREQIKSTPTVLLNGNYTGGISPFDIALLGVESPLTFIENVIDRILLPQPDAIPTGDVQLFGWGSISMTNVIYIPDILQTVKKDLMSVPMCREVLRTRYPHGTPIHSSNICTGPLNSVVTACVGDSGGPIVQANEDDALVIVGIASWISEFPCGAINAVSVYTRVSAFNDWIQERTGPL